MTAKASLPMTDSSERLVHVFKELNASSSRRIASSLFVGMLIICATVSICMPRKVMLVACGVRFSNLVVMPN